VALSSCNANYVAATAAACQGMRLYWLLEDLICKNYNSTTILIDNQSAI
jgi:hypothetical protein